MTHGGQVNVGFGMKLRHWCDVLVTDGLQILFWVAVSLIGGIRGLCSATGALRSEIGRDGGRAKRRYGRARQLIWRDPGRSAHSISAPDLGQSRPSRPSRFLEQTHQRIATVCVGARRARPRVWRVKWGSRGQHRSVLHSPGLGCGLLRRDDLLRAGGAPSKAHTELQRAPRPASTRTAASRTRGSSSNDKDAVKHFDAHSWAWNDNPFVGTRELNGLKILMMLLSNWDNKDGARCLARLKTRRSLIIPR